jgi:hypothetical protein
VNDVRPATADEPEQIDDERHNLVGIAVLALLIGAGIAWADRVGATALLIAVVAAQALLAGTWTVVLRYPGRRGGLVVAALAAAASDVATSVWPHSRLAAMLAVVGLAVPVMFVHQLLRGAARVRVAESLGAIALLVVAEAAFPALMQLRHELPSVSLGGDAVVAVVLAAAGALAAGAFTDLLAPTPRFDAEVPRGLVGVAAATLIGAAIGHLVLRDSHLFASGRGAFVGGAVGVLTALCAIGTAFAEHGVPVAESGFARRARPLLSVLVPMALVAPAGLLLCLAARI